MEDNEYHIGKIMIQVVDDVPEGEQFIIKRGLIIWGPEESHENPDYDGSRTYIDSIEFKYTDSLKLVQNILETLDSTLCYIDESDYVLDQLIKLRNKE